MAGVSTREIFTLQFGHYSNFVGSHLWNLLESSFTYNTPGSSTGQEPYFNHDVMFREGRTLIQSRVTFTPRLLLYDVKGSISCIPVSGTMLYPDPDPDFMMPWTGGDITLSTSSPTHQQNEYLRDLKMEDEEVVSDDDEVKEKYEIDTNDDDSTTTPSSVGQERVDSRSKVYTSLEEGVRSWGDYLRVMLHPRSIHILNQFNLCSEPTAGDVGGIDWFETGASAFKEELFEEDLRFFSEESDYLQGFHVLLDSQDGMSGFGSRAIQALSQDYPGKIVAALPCQQPAYSTVEAHRRRDRCLLNSLCTVAELYEHSDHFIPLQADHDHKHTGDLASSNWSNPLPFFRPTLPFHSSALFGVFLENLTAPYRLTNSNQQSLSHMAHLSTYITLSNHKMASARLIFPFSLDTNMTNPFCNHTLMPNFGQAVSTQPSIKLRCYSQYHVVRGGGIEPLSPLHSSPDSSPWDQLQERLNTPPLSPYPRGNEGLFLALPLSQSLKLESPFPHLEDPLVIDSQGRFHQKTRCQNSFLDLTQRNNFSSSHASFQRISPELIHNSSPATDFLHSTHRLRSAVRHFPSTLSLHNDTISCRSYLQRLVAAAEGGLHRLGNVGSDVTQMSEGAGVERDVVGEYLETLNSAADKYEDN